jgi:hypothetical protein
LKDPESVKSLLDTTESDSYANRDPTGADHGAVDINRQSVQIELLNLPIERFTVDPRQRTK